MRSKITLNRHGEIAHGEANNMRLYEATGCGALLATDGEGAGRLLGDHCIQYSEPNTMIGTVRRILDEWDDYAEIAVAGSEYTCEHNTYANRVGQFLEVVERL